MKTKLLFIFLNLICAIITLQNVEAQVRNKTLDTANTELSNLTSPTAVNQSLLPGLDNSINLGSSPNSWKNIYFKGAFFKGANRFIFSPNTSSTYIGTKAGNSVTVGFANTGVGDSALYSNTEGLYNTATGFYALRFNKLADYNTANGSYALSSNVSGSDNTAVGSQSLDRNSSGNFNTGSGYASLYNNTTGQSNTATGYLALELNNTGSFNTAYGNQSLHSNTTGSDNTAIGDSADVTIGSLTNATAIGAYAKVAQSNSLILGGTGSHAVNVGIGTTSPVYKLDINTGSSGLAINVAGTNPIVAINSTSISTQNSGSDLYLRAREPKSGTPGNLILQDNAVDNVNHYLGGSVGIGTTNPWYGGTSAKVVQLSATDFPQYLLQATAASTDNKVWRAIARNNNLFQIQTLSDAFGSEQTGLQLTRNANSITTVSFPNGNVGIGTSAPLQKLHVAGASILANNTTINPNTTANTVIAGAIHDGSGWAVSSGIGGKASGTGQEWGIGYAGNSLYFGLGDGSSDNTMQTGIQIFANTDGSRNVLLVPGGSGSVGIGTSSVSAYKLDVCGTIRAKEVLVQTGWCDYVFNKDYKLRSLNDVENYINQNKHLPDVPSATDVEDKGVKVAQMDSILIKKVEELTLYVIDQNKQIQQLQQKLIQLEKSDADKKN